MKRKGILVLATVLFSPTILGAQVQNSATVEAAINNLRARGAAAGAISLLAGERGGLTMGEKDALADSVVAIAIDYQEGDTQSRYLASVAAGIALTSSAGPERAVPYPRAFQALVRVYEGSKGTGSKGRVLKLMTRLPSAGRVVNFLAEAAVSPDPDPAYAAVQLLEGDLGPAGLGRLRQLFKDEAVVNPEAMELLTSFAETHGWGNRTNGPKP